ncbi:peptidase M16 [Leptospira perolatii]|uniref:Peptidase M16 n=1 Tax=Leptospira perolatii TaxID=2023191 RepID=A0A2M9ZKM7_9LEPT|nr:insulinase family protein [Leptospira perolatii]PJZ69389.1 peptidase M16 [Leptospira perolatii]PJZ72524.1 peptidase M16 [Leptospira perolatii]
MKKATNKTYLFILLFVSYGILSAPGDFVKDIKLPELEFHFPEVKESFADPNTRVLFLPNSEFPVRTIEIHFYSGSEYYPNIPPELPEIFAESWKKGGTRSLPGEKFAEVWESYGSKLSVDSDFDSIVVTFSWLSKYDKESRKLISDFLKEPELGQEAFEFSKLQLSEQIKRRNENISSLAYRKAREVAYKGKVRGNSLSIRRLDALSPESLSSFYKDNVRKSSRAVLITGEWNESELSEFVGEILPKIDGKPASEFQDSSQEALEKSLKSLEYKNLIIDKDNTQNVVLFLGIGPSHNHPDFFAIQLLNYIIGGGGFNSYFMSKIRSDKGLAYSSSSYPMFESDHSVLYFATQTKAASTMEVYDLMGEILSDETFSNISEEELRDAKEAILNKFIFLFTDSMEILKNELRFREHDMPKDYLRTYRDKILSVSLNDLRRIGKVYFRRDRLFALIAGPQSSSRKNLPTVKKIGPEDSVP